MSLNRKRVEDLHNFAEIDALHQLVDFFVIKIVREDQQGLGNVARLRKTNDQMPQVCDSLVHLHHDDDRIILQRPEDFFVYYCLVFVVSVDGALDITDVHRLIPVVACCLTVITCCTRAKTRKIEKRENIENIDVEVEAKLVLARVA